MRIIFTFFITFLISGFGCKVISQTIILGGFVSGNWIPANSPYLIRDDILVHPDSALSIDAGTTVLFSGPYLLEVQGQLLVTGSPALPVVFDRENDTITWRGIFFNTTDTSLSDSSILQHGYISHCYQRPCIDIRQSGRTRVSGFVIENGESYRGAGISCLNSNPRFDGLTIRNNHSLDGAGISMENSSPVIKNCTISQNSADGAGGGIVIFNSGSPYFENCHISGNFSIGSGGGVYISGADPVFLGCQFTENEGAVGGGNLYSGGGVSVKLGADPYFENCIFKNNMSHREGGGLASFSPNILINCSFESNSAGNYGGGAFISSGNLIDSRFTNCTFSENDAPLGSAMAMHNHRAIARNCIFWHNNPPDPASMIYLDSQFSWNLLDVAWSDIRNGQGGIEDSGTTQFTWGPGNIALDPAFEPGGLELSWQSPCIEAGTPDTTGLELPELDLAWNPRLINARIDMGSFEYQFPVIIQNSKLKIKNSIGIFPNPSKDYILVNHDEISGDLNYELINQQGAGIKSGQISAGNSPVKIDLQGIAPGFYLIIISGEGLSYTDKIIMYR